MVLDASAKRLIALALEEDLGTGGDITSRLIPSAKAGRAQILAKSDLVVAGHDAFVEVCRQVDASLVVKFDVPEGTPVEAPRVLGHIEGNARSMLAAERPALNLMQRLCGIASMAHSAQSAVAGTKARVVDTRKTTPGLRSLEKAAVRAGGAYNHRIGLFDGVLIKDNHIAAVGSVQGAIEKAREEAHHLLKIECEVDSLAQVDEALSAGADIILLDNMDNETMAEAVRRIGGRALVEASGGVTIDRLPGIAATGVDLISMGALTHSAKAADISLDWEA